MIAAGPGLHWQLELAGGPAATPSPSHDHDHDPSPSHDHDRRPRGWLGLRVGQGRRSPLSSPRLAGGHRHCDRDTGTTVTAGTAAFKLAVALA
jgi:hypothetical protein